MTDQEKEVLANREKDKGNEAFRAGDLKEALLYYTRYFHICLIKKKYIYIMCINIMHLKHSWDVYLTTGGHAYLI